VCIYCEAYALLLPLLLLLLRVVGRVSKGEKGE